MDLLARVCRLAAVLIVMSIVLSPLRAMAAALPVFVATVQAVGPTATTQLRRADAVRGEAEPPRINTHDAPLFGYDDPANPRVSPGAGAVHAYHGNLEFAHRREVHSEGAIYDAPIPTTATEAVGQHRCIRST